MHCALPGLVGSLARFVQQTLAQVYLSKIAFCTGFYKYFSGLFERLSERIRIALKQLFQYQLPYPFFEHHIAESVNAVFVNVVIVDQVFKRLFHLRRPFEPDPLQVVNLVYIFPPENTKQRAGFFLVGCQLVPDISILMEPAPKNFCLIMFNGRLCNFTFFP
jgi:hypothetical protein